MGGKITPQALRQMKVRGEKIAVLTAYDVSSARLEDEAGIEVILVGDSLGQVVLGHPSTLPVTIEDMIHHTLAVSRARPRSLIVADMPFLSFQVSVESALANAGRLVKEGGAEAVKLEGGERVVPQIRAMVESGIPVMGHLGLTPQSVLQFGGYRVQGRGEDAGERLRRDARLLEEAGCFAMVLEAIPWPLAREISGAVSIPTIGIGAGPHTDGQVLVMHDLLGLFDDFAPRFVKRYAELGRAMRDAFAEYVADVKSGAFPDLDRSYGADERQAEAGSPGPGTPPPAATPPAAAGRKARPGA